MTKRREDPSGALGGATARGTAQLLDTARVALADVLDSIPSDQRTARHLIASAGAILDAAGDVLVLRSTTYSGPPTAPPLVNAPATDRDTRNPSPATRYP